MREEVGYMVMSLHVKTLLLEAAKQKQFTSSLSELNPFSLFLESI